MIRIFKATAYKNGDGWKDQTRRGEVEFVYAYCKPPPYVPDQYPRVGNAGWTLGPNMWDFENATFWETVKLIPKIWKDRHYAREDWIRMVFGRMPLPTRPTPQPEVEVE